MSFRFFTVFLLFILTVGCKPPLRIAGKIPANPLERALAAQAGDFDEILSHPERYELQIIYTQIDRDAEQRPHFKSFYWNVDSSRYFYPASTVKLPLALLALEKLNKLRQSGYPQLSRDTPYMIDSVRMYQKRVWRDPSAPQSRPSVAQDIRKILVVSDNEAYNHLFEFLGRAYINNMLQAKGYNRTGIVHRFGAPGRENEYGSPLTFYNTSGGLYKQGATLDTSRHTNPQHHTRKGRAYVDTRDSMVNEPFDFAGKNWFALTDMEKMLRAVLFPEAVPERERFGLSADDYRFVRHYMGIFPRECDFPRYDTAEYYDGYVKFFMFGDAKTRRDGKVRVFNKVGEAYGTLTDVAYIVDFERNTEFVLAATILCNEDAVFNDDHYDYDQIGYPFLARLGRAVHAFDSKRKQAVKPDLSMWEDILYRN